MLIDIVIADGAIDLAPLEAPGCGAVVCFEGRVRAEEKGRVIDALFYEAYQPMAEIQMEKIVRDLLEKFPCERVRIRHRIGRVPVGEASILVEVCARHRAGAFALATAFMDRLKQDVPIWKISPPAA